MLGHNISLNKFQMYVDYSLCTQFNEVKRPLTKDKLKNPCI